MIASPTSLPVWIGQIHPLYPQALHRHLMDDVPQRFAALGNLDLLQRRTLAFLCSVKCPGNIILQTCDLAKRLREAGVPVIGGFHSPMERECLRFLLRGKQPIIICPARSLEGMRLPSDYKKPLDQGRLLLLSPFSGKLRRATVQTSLYRNRFAAALADRFFVPYAAPTSKTEQVCRALLVSRKRVYTGQRIAAPMIGG